MQLLVYGADPNWHNPALEQRTALHQTVIGNHCVFIDLLIQNNANILETDERGWTALHYAAYLNACRPLYTLLSSRKNIQPDTLLDLACEFPVILFAEN